MSYLDPDKPSMAKPRPQYPFRGAEMDREEREEPMKCTDCDEPLAPIEVAGNAYCTTEGAPLCEPCVNERGRRERLLAVDKPVNVMTIRELIDHFAAPEDRELLAANDRPPSEGWGANVLVVLHQEIVRRWRVTLWPEHITAQDVAAYRASEAAEMAERAESVVALGAILGIPGCFKAVEPEAPPKPLADEMAESGAFTYPVQDDCPVQPWEDESTSHEITDGAEF